MAEAIDPVALQAWCDAHPDYAQYKLECEKLRREYAAEKGISYEQLLEDIRSWPAITNQA